MLGSSTNLDPHLIVLMSLNTFSWYFVSHCPNEIITVLSLPQIYPKTSSDVICSNETCPTSFCSCTHEVSIKKDNIVQLVLFSYKSSFRKLTAFSSIHDILLYFFIYSDNILGCITTQSSALKWDTVHIKKVGEPSKLAQWVQVWSFKWTYIISPYQSKLANFQVNTCTSCVNSLNSAKRVWFVILHASGEMYLYMYTVQTEPAPKTHQNRWCPLWHV